MLRALLLSFVVLAPFAAVAASCGGSSSETPWPAEPSPAIMVPPPEPTAVSDDDAGARRRKD